MPEIIDLPTEPQQTYTPKPPPVSPPRPPRQPARTPPQSAPKDSPKQRSAKDKELQQQLSDYYSMGGTLILGAGLAREDEGIAGTGNVLAAQADTIAAAWLDVADKNPSVKRSLYRLVEVSAAGTLIGCHLMALVPFLGSRGIVPAGMANAMMAKLAADMADSSESAPDS